MGQRVRQATGKVSTATLRREDDVRLHLLELWPQIESQFSDKVVGARWSRDVNLLNGYRQGSPVDEFSLNVIATNIALLLGQIGDLDNPVLEQLAHLPRDSSLHLEYRQGINIAAQHNWLSLDQSRRVESIVYKGGQGPAGILFALLAQMGQLGRALSEATEHLTVEEQYLSPLAKGRLYRLSQLVADRDLTPPAFEPATIDIIGALWKIAGR